MSLPLHIPPPLHENDHISLTTPDIQLTSTSNPFSPCRIGFLLPALAAAFRLPREEKLASWPVMRRPRARSNLAPRASLLTSSLLLPLMT